MGAAQIIALFGGVGVAAAVRLSNVLLAGLARILGVEPPAPIPEPGDDDDDTSSEGTAQTE